jgi:hypothetical protein
LARGGHFLNPVVRLFYIALEEGDRKETVAANGRYGGPAWEFTEFDTMGSLCSLEGGLLE